MPVRGYSIFQRNGRGSWYIAYKNGEGKRVVEKASVQKSIAHEIGRRRVADADRVRAGVLDPAEMRRIEAGRESIGEHVAAWKRSIVERGNTQGHAELSAKHALTLLNAAGAGRLSDLRAERVQSAVAEVAEQSSPQNARHYLTALRGFIKWCARTGRLAADPIAGVQQPAVAGKTFKRTPLSDAQLRKLLSATAKRDSNSTFGGRDRAMYYAVMANTGLRKNEARSLTPESFQLRGREPAVVVAAAYAKNRREDRIPITTAFSARLREWLKGRTPGEPVFKIATWANLSRVFAADCRAAGIAAGRGERLGVHSLRRFFITRVVLRGGLAVGQALARHSTPTLTVEYTDLTARDKRRAIAGLGVG